MPPVHFALIILEMGVSQAVCSLWPWIMILWSSLSLVSEGPGLTSEAQPSQQLLQQYLPHPCKLHGSCRPSGTCHMWC
jgi:hypothetical protein